MNENKIKMKKLVLSLLIVLFGQATVLAQKDCNLLPKPQQMEVKGGSFALNHVKLVTPVLQSDWEAFVAEAGGQVDGNATRLIEVKLVPAIEGAELNQEEAYRLTVTGKAITIEAVTETGAYWAMQTLRQLAVKKSVGSQIKNCQIVDWEKAPPILLIRSSRNLRLHIAQVLF